MRTRLPLPRGWNRRAHLRSEIDRVYHELALRQEEIRTSVVVSTVIVAVMMLRDLLLIQPKKSRRVVVENVPFLLLREEGR